VNDLEEVPDHWGLLPRACFNLLKECKGQGLTDKDFQLSLKVAELSWKDPICLINKKPIKIDQTTDDYICGHEFSISSVKDII
jgi:hypothetical protein